MAPMAQEVLTWGGLVLGGGALVTIITFWMTLGSRLTTAEVKAAAAETLAARLEQKHDAVLSALGDYRVAMEVKIAVIKTLAETNTSALTAAENRFAKALEDLRESFRQLTERMDRMLEAQKD
jgi:hypothetical protein